MLSMAHEEGLDPLAMSVVGGEFVGDPDAAVTALLAIPSFDRAYELDSRQPTRAIEAALAELRLGRDDVAEARLVTLLSAHPRHAAVQVNLAAMKLREGDLATARSLAEQALVAEVSSSYYRRKAEAILERTRGDASPPPA